MRFIISTFFLIIVFALAASAQQSLKEGTAAPEFSAPAMNGQVYDLNQLQGKVVVITFWSTKCEICHSEIPKLNQMAERYKGRDVVFLALTMENEAKVENYLRSTPFNFTIVPNSFGMVMQYADRDKAGNINMGFPAYFLVDQSGSIQVKASGWDKTSAIDSRISSLLSSPTASKTSAEK
ncbi:MAG: TlpA disulfide reductase family protein [Acidobacteriota bacterium]